MGSGIRDLGLVCLYAVNFRLVTVLSDVERDVIPPLLLDGKEVQMRFYIHI